MNLPKGFDRMIWADGPRRKGRRHRRSSSEGFAARRYRLGERSTGRRYSACSRGSKMPGDWRRALHGRRLCVPRRRRPRMPKSRRTAHARRSRADMPPRSQPTDEGLHRPARRRPIHPPEMTIGNARSNSNNCTGNARCRSAGAGLRRDGGRACGPNFARSVNAASHFQSASGSRCFEQVRRRNRGESHGAAAMRTDPAWRSEQHQMCPRSASWIQ